MTTGLLFQKPKVMILKLHNLGNMRQGEQLTEAMIAQASDDAASEVSTKKPCIVRAEDNQQSDGEQAATIQPKTYEALSDLSLRTNPFWFKSEICASNITGFI